MRPLLLILGIFAAVGAFMAFEIHRANVIGRAREQEELARIEAARHPVHPKDLHAEAMKQSSDQLLVVYQHGKADTSEWQASTQVLAERKNPSMHDALRSVLETSKDKAERIEAAKDLGYFEDPGDFDTLSKLAKGDDPDVAAAAARSLGRLHDPRALAVLRPMMEHGHR